MDFIIRRKTLISMVFMAMVLLGIISYNKLPMELYPTPELPVMVVMVNSIIEVDPGYMEQQAIVPLEGYYCINDSELVLILEKNTQEIVDVVLKVQPKKVVALDRLFKGNDQLKTNTSLQMKDAGVEFKTI